MNRLVWAVPRRVGGTTVVVGYRLRMSESAARHGVGASGTAEPETVIVVERKRARGWRIDGSRCDPAELRLQWVELDRILLDLGV